ncbi:MAG: serine/threonine protein kinase [Deltaproteobacteria bacterium]|nr:serine/threonine protein kinase [Deltaproteobacteria bacterium]
MSVVESQTFGEKYVLFERIGTGGMAEVYKGKLLGKEGFEKPVVIKKLLQQHASNKELTQVFIGEARLAALLQHDNIAATYDFGQIDGDYFLALEYLQGRDLFEVLQRAKEYRDLFTVQHALMIASKICEGMEYAHNLKDLQQNSLNIVHRDLTPHNIFITYEGRVKIIDFGIAKAELVDNMTKEGVVKGKISYMSPEQLSGGQVDSRSDIFSIGILLYEMISRQRMYTGDTGELIRKCITVDYDHLEESVPGLDSGLYRTVDKALARDIEKRYQTCAELQTDLDDLIYSLYERPDPKILKETVRNLFSGEFDREKSGRRTSTLIDGRTLNSHHGAQLLNEGGDDLLPESEKTVVYDDCELTGREKTEIFDTVQTVPRGTVQRYKVFFSLAIISSIIFIPIFTPPLFKKSSPSAPSPLTVQEAVKLPSPPATVSREVVPLSAVEKLARRAEEAMQAGRLLQPADDSVFKYYSDILGIDPEDTVARDGLLQIRERYAVLAGEALAARKYNEAGKLVDIGLVAFPGYQRLHVLKSRIESDRMEQISLLDKKAKRSLSRNRLTTPANDSAFLYFSEIKKLDPGSRVAKEGLTSIADRYLLFADSAYRQFEYEKSRVFVEKGLRVAPGHGELKLMKEELAKSKPEVFFKTLGKNISSFFSQ